MTPMRTEVIIRATRTQNVLGAALQHMYARVFVWRGLEVAALRFLWLRYSGTRGS